MKRFKLTLTTEDGLLVEQWTLSTNPADEDADYVAPIAMMAGSLLAESINDRIRQQGGIQGIEEGGPVVAVLTPSDGPLSRYLPFELSLDGLNGAMTEMVEKAVSIAVRAHFGQKRKDGSPYIFHPLRVMTASGAAAHRIDDRPRTKEVLMAAAVLHDVPEDCGVTIQTIAENIDPEVAVVVDRLTQRPGEKYRDYVARAAGNALARLVKIQDVLDNMNGAELIDAQLGTKLVSRYELALRILKHPVCDHDH